MFSSFRNRAQSDDELANRLAHVVDPRRFALFASVRSSSRAVRQLRAESFPHIARDLERFRLSVSGHGQFSKLAELPVKINPDEDRVAVARMKNGGEVILGGPFMDVWFLLKDEGRPQFLSFVVGHEYGHLVSKTKARGLRYLKKVCTVKFLAAGILGLNPRGESERRYRIAARAHHSGEFSADAFSARFCTELGYDPERGISAMELTEWLEGGDVAKESLTHPSTKDRIERVLNSYHSTKTKPGAPAHPEELDEDPAPPPPHP